MRPTELTGVRARMTCPASEATLQVDRKRVMQFTVQVHTVLSEPLLDTLAALDAGIFPSPFSKRVFERELQHRHNLSVFVAAVDQVSSAYKIGFEQSPDVYYSFSGGVVPGCRRQGIARALIAEQHRFARELGYRAVRTHTKNIYRQMLLLDIASGFDVVGVIQKTGEQLQSIVLEKLL